MSRLPPALAHRLDRLARRAHAFHRLAHHPLCGRYAGEVVRLGRRTRLCRGCALAAAGAAAGLAVGAAAPPPPPGLLAAGVGLLALSAAWGAGRRAGRARPKLLSRALPAALAAAVVAAGPRSGAPAGWAMALAAAAAAAGAALAWRRRGPDRGACDGCPEGPPGPACSGLAPVARRERAFQRLAGRWIAAGPGRASGEAPIDGDPRGG